MRPSIYIASLALAGAASAQTTEIHTAPAATTEVRTTEVEVILPKSEPQFGVSLLGGGAGFAGYAARRTDVGPTWGVAVTLQANPFIGLEGSYQGERTQAEGVVANPFIDQNGAQALLKVGPRIQGVRLFALAGGAVAAFRVEGGDTARDASGNVLVREGTLYKLPVGGGVAAHVPGGYLSMPELVFGARATYDFVLNANDVFPDVPSSRRMADEVRVQLEVGARF